MILLKKEGVKEIMTAAEAAESPSIHPKKLYRLPAASRIPFVRKPRGKYRPLGPAVSDFNY